MAEPLIYIDGKWYPKGDAKISVYDHGLLYGDGVFEGIRCYSGNVFRLKEHIDRLYESARIIGLNIPASPEEMSEIVVESLRKNSLTDAYTRLIVTRGYGDLGLNPRKCPMPTVICISQNFAPLYGDLYEKGIKVKTVKTVRIAPEALDTRAKTLNYVNNILANVEAIDAGYDEALMMDSRGKVCEGSGDNIFIVKNGKLLTPKVGYGALVGITRGAVLDMAKELDIKSEEADLELEDVLSADEAFMTGTAAEIIPIIRVDDNTLGSGKPGDMTRKLMAEFAKLRENDGEKI
jgi:branched-chain amino acid aminotransferase